MKSKGQGISRWMIFMMISIWMFQACTSPQEYLESGDYERAISRAVDKLAGKKKKTKYVEALELAFEKATARDMARADRLKREGSPGNWPRIYDIYVALDRRQKLVEPLLPLIDEHGLKASFKFVKVGPLINDAKKKAAAHYYVRALDYLDEAKTGNKLAARKAYKELNKIDRYYRSYKDKVALQYQAQELGTTHVVFDFQNRASVMLPRQLIRNLENVPLQDLNEKWIKYHRKMPSGKAADYMVKMNINHIQVSPEMIKERSYEDSREIEDGFDYVLDENGNVMKDTAGNDIKIPRIILARAQVLEVYQNKGVTLFGQLEFMDNYTKDIIDSKPLTVDAIFENYASTFRGDKRALSADSKLRIGNSPQPFPSDELLILQAFEDLKPLIKRTISKNRIMI